jgi:hypothetical protein
MWATLKDLTAAVAAAAMGMAVGFCLAMAALIGAQPAHAFSLSKDIPAQAAQYLPMLGQQARELLPAVPPEYFGALIEHESGCPSIKSMCWKPTARLKSQREEGAGLGQLTRAYRADGSLRFDSLTESRKLDPRGLNDLRWETVYQRPDLQMRVMVLMTRQNYNRVAKLVDDQHMRLQLTDLSYNAGFGRVLNDRRACGLTHDCDPDRWEDHVEKTCTASKKPLYGTRSACDISRHHVHDVVGVRMPKYKGRV